jgi:RsiW-degrading membrane proteinase PrsW (M82 family)
MTVTNPTSRTTDYTASASVNAPAPAAAPKEVSLQTASNPVVHPVSSTPRRGSTLLVLGIIGVIILSLLALFVVVYLIAGLGGDAFALGGIMALIPLVIVFLGIRWIDRWEPEPRLAVVFAFLWGAAVSVLIALIVGAELDQLIVALSEGSDFAYQFIGAAIQAPIVEETGKGLGVLILFWAARKYFDGPVDGIVYAAWVAGGFAFTENILYFGSQLLDSGGFDRSVFEIFLIRGIMSPFAHVMFTSFIGIALGLAARRTGAFGAIGFFLVGLIPAILLHALWNGALFFVSDFFGYYAIVQVPLFVMAILLVLFLRRQESKLTFDRLSEYASVGWFNEAEVAAIATPRGRRQAKAWAASQGKRKQMRSFIHDATRLAFARQRIITGRGRGDAVADEALLLASIAEDRKGLAGLAAAVQPAAGTGAPTA